MIGNFLRVTKSELDLYLRDSSKLEKRVYNNVIGKEDAGFVEIDKSWDGINFLLTGAMIGESDAPLSKVMFSGQSIDENQDMGYGPAQYLTPKEVGEINTEISKISVEGLKLKYDGEKMNRLGIYPNVWEEEVALDYLLEYFIVVQEVFAIAAKNEEGIITFLN